MLYVPKRKKRNDKQDKHFLDGIERRKNRGMFIPTLYLLIEGFGCYLILYIINLGKSIEDWNLFFVAIMMLFFLTSSIPRYIKVLQRSK